jgi:hypothetical protein
MTTAPRKGKLQLLAYAGCAICASSGHRQLSHVPQGSSSDSPKFE